MKKIHNTLPFIFAVVFLVPTATFAQSLQQVSSGDRNSTGIETTSVTNEAEKERIMAELESLLGQAIEVQVSNATTTTPAIVPIQPVTTVPQGIQPIITPTVAPTAVVNPAQVIVQPTQQVAQIQATQPTLIDNLKNSLRQQIQSLQTQIQSLQSQTGAVAPTENIPVTAAVSQFDGVECQVFRQSLGFGSRDGVNGVRQVVELQLALRDFGIYSGPISGFFGSQTEAAMARWQQAFASEVLTPIGRSTANGLLSGPSLNKMNELVGCSR